MNIEVISVNQWIREGKLVLPNAKYFAYICEYLWVFVRVPQRGVGVCHNSVFIVLLTLIL